MYFRIDSNCLFQIEDPLFQSKTFLSRPSCCNQQQQQKFHCCNGNDPFKNQKGLAGIEPELWQAVHAPKKPKNLDTGPGAWSRNARDSLRRMSRLANELRTNARCMTIWKTIRPDTDASSSTADQTIRIAKSDTTTHTSHARKKWMVRSWRLSNPAPDRWNFLLFDPCQVTHVTWVWTCLNVYFPWRSLATSEAATPHIKMKLSLAGLPCNLNPILCKVPSVVTIIANRLSPFKLIINQGSRPLLCIGKATSSQVRDLKSGKLAAHPIMMGYSSNMSKSFLQIHWMKSAWYATLFQQAYHATFSWLLQTSRTPCVSLYCICTYMPLEQHHKQTKEARAHSQCPPPRRRNYIHSFALLHCKFRTHS